MKSCEHRQLDCGCIGECELRAIESPAVSAGLVRLIYRLLLITLVIVGLVALFWRHAHAHDAIPTAAQPKGWSYPFACCSGLDCRAIGNGQSQSRERVYETAEGYRFQTSGEIIPYGDKRIKDSPDGEFHWCTERGESSSRTICLFVPPRAF